MATALFRHEKIKSTKAKCLTLQPFADKLITVAKRGDLHGRRLVARVIADEKICKKLCDEIAPRYVERNGGYTRVLKTGRRIHGDAAETAIIELVEKA